jgi:asparagine synthase (glutamine-hydrolysing)
MCGIAGVYPGERQEPAVIRDAVEAMTVHMATRGPDGQGVLALGPGAPVLGHRRLSIIDLDPRSNQPLSSADGRLTIVYNGEIYNYRELRSQLLGGGESFRTTSDTEVLLALYRREGRGMLARLRGMFAFALWDREAESLLVARDPHGIKPLYYADVAAGFVFASRAKAVLASGLVPAASSPAGLAGFYLWGSVPEPWTVHRSVRALPAGHWLEVRRGIAGAPRAWYDVSARFGEPERRCSPRELAVRVRSAVRDTVRAHRVADVPISVFLSGGIDSGALAGVLAAEGARVEGITIACAEFEGTPQDEVPRARAIARHYSLEHHVRQVTQRELSADLPHIVAAMDQPSIDGINTWFASKAAAERGYKVALSGIGGDELFCGYASFAALPRATRVARGLLRVPGARAALAGAGVALAALQQKPKLRALGESVGTLEGLYQLRRGLFMPEELPRLMGASAAREGLEALGDFASSRVAAAARHGTAQVALLESTRYLRNQLLRDSDWASMAHSVELRTPLVDARLSEELYPYLESFADGHGKRLLAECPERPLPSLVIGRDKTGFGLPLETWLRSATAPTPARAQVPWARRWARYLGERWLT